MKALKAVSIKYVGRVWPDKHVGIGRVKEVSASEFMPDDLEYGEEPTFPFGCLTVEETEDEFCARTMGPSGMGLSNVSKNHKPPQRRGQGGITRYGRRMLTNCVYLIERDAPYDTLSFLTLTVPPMDVPNYGRLMSEWSEIVRVYTQWLSRRLKSNGLSGEVAYCTEIHPRRSSETGLDWPHIHLVFQGASKANAWRLTPAQVGEKWKEVVCSRIPGIKRNFKKSHWNLQKVLKSASSYLGKYISKGVQRRQDTIEGKEAPWKEIRCWWGAVGGVKTRVKQETLYLSTEECLALLEKVPADSVAGNEYWKFYRDIHLSFQDAPGKIWIGAAGRVTNLEYKMIKHRRREMQAFYDSIPL